jgi:threonylcarbamoyladenosine tRNA methylthiotransferase MtaB
MPSLAVRNFGCRVNQAEAFAWAEAFRERGLRLEENWGRSDVVLVNSCALTARAERDVRKFIRTVARARPEARIVVTGCYAERAPAEVSGMPNVVAVLPQSAKDRLPERAIEIARRLPGEPMAAKAEEGPVARPGGEGTFRARAYLKVQDGCDDRCAFCVIPSVRGRSRSVGPDDVAAEVRRLAGRGFREIVLAGIHLSSYGEDLEPKSSLLELLRAIEVYTGDARIRLSSLDPRKTGEELVTHIAGRKIFCPHFHLSLQHASDRLLRLMGRVAGTGSYERVLGGLRRLSPDAALGADVIVGFPGESEADFRELRGFLESSPLTYIHVFPYSPRPGTPAAARPPVPAAVVAKRAGDIRRLAAMKDYRFHRRFQGRELEAVVIARSERGAEVMTGNAVRVSVPDCRAPVREVVRVAVRRVLPLRTEGEVVA